LNARLLTHSDAAALRALRLRGLLEHPLDFGADHDEEAAWSVTEWARRMMGTLWFGVERGGALIACASLRIPERVKLRHNGWINAMYVAAEAQGSGAGDAIMDAIEAEARARGVTLLKLYARENNSRACAFYRRRGFEAYGVEPDATVVGGVGYGALEMAKRL
jgi:GNAT superfamily N-acetyltransferase